MKERDSESKEKTFYTCHLLWVLLGTPGNNDPTSTFLYHIRFVSKITERVNPLLYKTFTKDELFISFSSAGPHSLGGRHRSTVLRLHLRPV